MEADAVGAAVVDGDEHRRLALAGPGGGQVGAPHRVHRLGDDGAVVGARAAGRADPRGGEQAVHAHQPQHPALGGAHAGVAQPGPDLPVPLAVEGAGGEHGADRLQQRRIRHRPDRAGTPRRLGGRRRGAGRRWRGPPARPGTPGPGRRACRRWARRSGSWPRPPPGQRAPALQGGDLGFEQFALEQHLAEPGLQPLAFERLTISGAGGQARLASGQEGVAPGGQRRRGDARASATPSPGPRPAADGAPHPVCAAATSAHPGQAHSPASFLPSSSTSSRGQRPLVRCPVQPWCGGPTTTPLGSSPGMATAPQTRSAPSNAALLSAHRPTYPRPPEQRSQLSQQPAALHCPKM